MTAQQLVHDYRDRAEQALSPRLPAADSLPTRLHEAMRYAVFNGGKRLRPVLLYAAGVAVGVELEQLDGPAVAVELVHTYSLIHDDLPAMDDDTLRRGMPTCHIAFDEAIAILAGDALQALAFDILARDQTMTVEAALRLRLIGVLADATGSHGMAGGQAIDLAAVGQSLTLPELEIMHTYKTGALIRACVVMGALCQPDISETTLEHLQQYASCIGLAFQIQDDILDVTSDTETLGKTQGADQDLSKPTYPALLGLEGAREHALRQYHQALYHLAWCDADTDVLRWLADHFINRNH